MLYYLNYSLISFNRLIIEDRGFTRLFFFFFLYDSMKGLKDLAIIFFLFSISTMDEIQVLVDTLLQKLEIFFGGLKSSGLKLVCLTPPRVSFFLDYGTILLK